MLDALSPLTRHLQALQTGHTTPASVADGRLAHANSNASRNTYLWLDPEQVRAQAAALSQTKLGAFPLPAVPISLKDCFDLAGAPTTCGTRFYAQRGAAPADSAMARSLRRSGALIPGKTHLHPLAYGITGQNPEYGDCLQPRDANLLTGGSSSGAAASVQEGSALAAIGTDTGGSIRVPAALCGLVGYRASHRLVEDWWPEAWQGAAHLAPSFDTVGFLLRDPRDAAPIAQALFSLPPGLALEASLIGCVPLSWLSDCDPEVLQGYAAWRQELLSDGARLIDLEIDTAPAPTAWDHAFEIFAGIQAHEAAQLHSGHYDQFETAIRDRLTWGASLDRQTVSTLRQRQADFSAAMAGLLTRFDFLMLPVAPVSRLIAGADQSSTRQKILRYTAPFSLSGLPALSLPGEIIGAPQGTGVQIAAAPGADPLLLAYAARIGRRIAAHSYCAPGATLSATHRAGRLKQL